MYLMYNVVVGWVSFFNCSNHKTCLVVPEKARNFGLRRPQRPQGQKNKYGSKCLELSNSARNIKIVKKSQRLGGPPIWPLKASNWKFKLTYM